MLCFLVTAAERLVAGVGVSSKSPGLMEFAFGRVSDTWDAPVLREATRNITTQHLFQADTSILEVIQKLPKASKTFLKSFNFEGIEEKYKKR